MQFLCFPYGTNIQCWCDNSGSSGTIKAHGLSNNKQFSQYFEVLFLVVGLLKPPEPLRKKNTFFYQLKKNYQNLMTH